jgi:hypothetical protein
MARTRHIVAARPDPAVTRVVERWLGEVSARLVGTRRARDAVLAELRDGLLEAVDAYRAGGAAAEQAAAAAIAEFGSPQAVSEAFAAELAARQARRTALALVGTGPLVGLLWLIAITSSHILTQPPRPEPPWMWPDLPTGLRITAAALGAALVIGIPSGLVAIATTGPLSNILRTPPMLAPTAAATIAVAGIAADLTLLIALASVAVIAPGRLAWFPMTIAALASGTRLALNAGATRRLLTTRVALA